MASGPGSVLTDDGIDLMDPFFADLTILSQLRYKTPRHFSTKKEKRFNTTLVVILANHQTNLMCFNHFTRLHR